MEAYEVWPSVPPIVTMEMAALALSLTDVMFRPRVPADWRAARAVNRGLGHELGLFDGGEAGAENKWLRFSQYTIVMETPQL